jgi:hypothetical protein
MTVEEANAKVVELARGVKQKEKGPTTLSTRTYRRPNTPESVATSSSESSGSEASDGSILIVCRSHA